MSLTFLKKFKSLLLSHFTNILKWDSVLLANWDNHLSYYKGRNKFCFINPS